MCKQNIKTTNMTTNIAFKLPTIAIITILISILLLNFNVNYISAIKCYVCQSNVDPKCADPFDNLTLPITDCDEYPRADLVQKSELDVIEEKGFFATFGLSAPVKPLRATMCRKVRQKVNGEWRTIRGCGYLAPAQQQQSQSSSASKELSNICEIRHGTYDIFMETCNCNSKDGCNGSNSFMNKETMIPKLIVTLIASVLIKFSFFSNEIYSIK